MKCIKEKCKYCNTHDFYHSYYSCYIGGSFEKDNKDVSCVIDSRIEDIEISLRDIKEYKEFIKKNSEVKTMLNWINKKLERRSLREFEGIPLLWLLYQPNKPEPNMEYRLHPSIRQDEYLKKQFKDIADYLRANYTGEWEHLEEEEV